MFHHFPSVFIKYQSLYVTLLISRYPIISLPSKALYNASISESKWQLSICIDIPTGKDISHNISAIVDMNKSG